MFLKEILKDNTILYKGWYINENTIGNKFIKTENCGGGNTYYRNNIELVINNDYEKNASSPEYTAKIFYWDGFYNYQQFDGLKTTYELNKAILEVKEIHKSSHWTHELIK